MIVTSQIQFISDRDMEPWEKSFAQIKKIISWDKTYIVKECTL